MEVTIPWDINRVEDELYEALEANSEVKLLEILKNNSFLFYRIYERRWSVQPIFHEVSIGDQRCDFLWLNDDASRPEFILVEIEKPRLKLFNSKGDPTAELNHAINQILATILPKYCE